MKALESQIKEFDKAIKAQMELLPNVLIFAFAEDIGDGDHTTLSCIPATAMGKSKLLIKEAGVLAGIEVAKEIFNRFDPTMKVEVFINDGTEVKPGDVAMVVEGKVQSLLQTERLRSEEHTSDSSHRSLSRMPSSA